MAHSVSSNGTSRPLHHSHSDRFTDYDTTEHDGV
jgi:hypothetical protein